MSSIPVNEAARHLRLYPEQVRRLIARGDLEGVKQEGKPLRVTWLSIARYSGLHGIPIEACSGWLDTLREYEARVAKIHALGVEREALRLEIEADAREAIQREDWVSGTGLAVLAVDLQRATYRQDCTVGTWVVDLPRQRAMALNIPTTDAVAPQGAA